VVRQRWRNQHLDRPQIICWNAIVNTAVWRVRPSAQRRYASISSLWVPDNLKSVHDAVDGSSILLLGGIRLAVFPPDADTVRIASVSAQMSRESISRGSGADEAAFDRLNVSSWRSVV
jgi:hypothetical protein